MSRTISLTKIFFIVLLSGISLLAKESVVYDSFKEDAQSHCCLVSCEYKDFLDHLAASDPYQLYDESMLEKKIVRLDWPGCYHYELTSQNDTVSAVNLMSLEDLKLYQIW